MPIPPIPVQNPNELLQQNIDSRNTQVNMLRPARDALKEFILLISHVNTEERYPLKEGIAFVKFLSTRDFEPDNFPWLVPKNQKHVHKIGKYEIHYDVYSKGDGDFVKRYDISGYFVDLNALDLRTFEFYK